MCVISAILIFYGAILLSIKNCPMIVLIILLVKKKTKKKTKEKLNLYMIKVQKSKLIKIIRYRRQTKEDR